MDDVRVVRLPRDLIERVDERAADELRSRNNMVTVLVRESLSRRESDAQDDEGSRDD